MKLQSLFFRFAQKTDQNIFLILFALSGLLTVPEVFASETSLVGTSSSTQIFKDPFSMRKLKKAGAGLLLGGQASEYGVIVELNIENDDGAIVSISQGSGVNAFDLGWKHTFDGTWVNPYTVLGYSRWFSGPGDVRDSSIMKQVLSSQELESGQFGSDFTVASAGLQYNQLAGDWVGLSFFFQFDLMQSWQKNQILAHGSLGSIFYF